MKTYEIKEIITSVCFSTVQAKDLTEAQKKFDSGDYKEEHEESVDCTLEYIKELKE